MVGTSCPGDAVWGRSWPGGAGGGSGQGLRRRVGNPGRLRPVPAGCCQETGTHSPARPAPASSLPAPALGPGVFRILDLDSADARQIQQPGVAVPSTGGSGDHPPLQCPGMAEPAGRGAGCAQGDSPVPWEEEHSWPQLLGSRPSPGHCSSSSSVCTEDFAARFWEGMVETLLGQQEPAGAVPGEGAHPGQDESVFPTGRSLHMRPQPATELGRAPRQDRPPSRSRRESLESLGARISHLSRSHGGVAWGAPWPSPPAQPALGHRDSPRGDLLAVALPGHSWRTPGLSAGRSRAGARTGSPGSSFPRASSARTRGHPNLGMRRQEPPALWGHGGNVTFTVDGMDREGADSSRRAGTAVAAPGQWRSPVSPGLRGGLPCKGQAVPLHWSLRRSQGDTRELGAGAKPWSQGDTARAGLALLGHTWDTPHRCHTDLQRMSWQGQGACVEQEQLDKEKRQTATSQEEKLELLERLRELQRDSRSLLQQRLRVLHRLHGLLQRDKEETLRQLREALEQDRPGTSVLREHLPSRPRGPAGPGRAGGSPPVGTPPLAPWGHGPRPGSAAGAGPSPAALGRALHVLRGLRQQIQRRLGQWQRVQGALGAAGQSQEEGQQPEKAPGAPRAPPMRVNAPGPAPRLRWGSGDTDVCLHLEPRGARNVRRMLLELPNLADRTFLSLVQDTGKVPPRPLPAPELHPAPRSGAAAGEGTEPACPGGTAGLRGDPAGPGAAWRGDLPSATAPALSQRRERDRAPPRSTIPGGNSPAVGLVTSGSSQHHQPCHGTSDP
ncbi:uncharacterized protein LOC134560112 isoform X3 [Prinia subflava]|uniref:uncharacterized protein LOC134560112 isoform X3 n=1 Tax=Prinia subflava TaxID=208062 RepID=UPI002FE2E4EC